MGTGVGVGGDLFVASGAEVGGAPDQTIYAPPLLPGPARGAGFYVNDDAEVRGVLVRFRLQFGAAHCAGTGQSEAVVVVWWRSRGVRALLPAYVLRCAGEVLAEGSDDHPGALAFLIEPGECFCVPGGVEFGSLVEG